MRIVEMIGYVQRDLQERAEALLAQKDYAMAAEVVSVLEALERAERLLSGAAASTPPRQTIRPSVSLPSEPDPSADGEREYPRFARVDEDLVKVGWSSKTGAEYVHRAPKTSVLVVCEAVKGVARGRRIFGREDLKGIVSHEGDGIPDYQVYLCLSWLRWAGLLNRVQRGKYAVPNLREFTRLWGRAWDQLPHESLQSE